MCYIICCNKFWFCICLKGFFGYLFFFRGRGGDGSVERFIFNKLYNLEFIVVNSMVYFKFYVIMNSLFLLVVKFSIINLFILILEK